MKASDILLTHQLKLERDESQTLISQPTKTIVINIFTDEPEHYKAYLSTMLSSIYMLLKYVPKTQKW